MNEDCLKLTTYFGERDRAKGHFLADELLDLSERHGFETSVLLRGTEGFGAKHRLSTQRLLTLSEDLPVVAIAVDTRERIERALPEVTEVVSGGLVTLERARMLSGRVGSARLPEELHDETKLTVYCGRGERIGSRPAFRAIVDLLHERGVAGATVLLGVDGTVGGTRRRATFFGRNPEVPLMVVSVGSGERIAALLPELGQMLRRPLVTLERIQVLKRDGRRLRDLPPSDGEDEHGMQMWQKLMVYAGEQARHAGRPLYTELIRRLREEETSGATALRGLWGYHGDHAPHGDRLLSLRRRVPVLTVIVDAPERIERAFAVVDELTDETGLVTCERVPALRATGPGFARGGLRLAERR